MKFNTIPEIMGDLKKGKMVGGYAGTGHGLEYEMGPRGIDKSH